MVSVISRPCRAKADADSCIASFSYSFLFLDRMTGFEALPAPSIDPVPRLLDEPKFHTDSNTLDLVLSHFYSPDPLDVYLGPIGPLAVSTWQSIARPQKTYSTTEQRATPIDDSAQAGVRVMSAFPSTVPHVIVVVEMPSSEQIMRTMQECVSSIANGHGKTSDSQAGLANHQSPRWPEAPEEHGELTIQDPPRNAEKSGEADFDLSILPFDPDMIIDPALQAEGQPGLPGEEHTMDSMGSPELDGKPAGLTTEQPSESFPPPIVLSKPPQNARDHEMMPLPLLLVRRSDGVGYGSGLSVIAERLGMGTDPGIRLFEVE